MAPELEGEVVDGRKDTLVRKYITVNTKKLENKRAERFEMKLLPITI